VKLGWLACDGTRARWEAVKATLDRLADGRERRARTIHRYADLRPVVPGQN
jgi:hypothetical protein